MERFLLLDIILYGILVNNTWAWSVDVPDSVSGLHRSCIVIPCSFSYWYYPPDNPYRIVWYQYVDRGYPLVYDSWYPKEVIDKYRGRTSIYKGSYLDCSLVIDDLSLSHHKDRIYTWIDPENVGRSTFRFFDVTTLIHVKSAADKPIVSISGGYKIGESITVKCTTQHSCPYKPPSLSLTGIDKKPGAEDRSTNNVISPDGTWQITLTREGIVQSERHTFLCSVRHRGGLSESTTIIHIAQCSTDQARITPDSNTEFLEGLEQDIVCSVTYMCTKNQPQFRWNDGQLHGITSSPTKRGTKYEARSTLKFTAKADDHGRTITCQTNLEGNVRRVQITLRVKKSMGSLDWSITMPSAITGVRGSCVVIPCSYKFKKSQYSGAEVKWYKVSSPKDSVVYDQSTSNIINDFKGRTSLYGSNDKNCSLMIQPLEMQHKERLFPWMDQKSIEEYHRKNVNDGTITLDVTDTAEKPQAELLGIAKVGEPVTLSCSVLHTCPPTPPTLSLSISRETPSFTHTPLHNGIWKETIEITWTVEENDNSVTCTASYARGQTSKTEISLNPLCPTDQAQITPDSNTEFLEGVEQDIVCSVTYTCTKDRPYIFWSGEQLPGSTFHISKQGTKQKAESTLKFTPKASDNGKTITCQADFKGNVQTVEITLRVQRSMGSLDWSFTMPSTITGIRGSCVVIPCNYEFKNLQHSTTNVKWYKLSTSGYLLVYDQSTNNIINRFKGKTSLFGSSNGKNCSLKIEPLEMQHSQERLFPWMDPNSIESYHSKNFDHETIALEVTDIAALPQADLLGIAKVGEPVTLSCSVIHTCPPTPPTLSLSLSNSRGTRDLIHTPLHNGKWKLTMEVTWTVEEYDKFVTCTVSYAGGQTSKTEISLNPLCDFQKPVISPSQDEAMEGIEKSFTCTVNHTCQKEKPSIIWNYQNLPVSVETRNVSPYSWKTVSTLKLKPSRHDHGKTLTCTAQTTERETSDHVTLKVKRGMHSLDWTYTMPSKITGLRGSCLVIPCSFDFKTEQHSNVKVKWYLYSTTEYPLVYGPDNEDVLSKFNGKTRLYGLPSEKNCSLEIKQLDMLHNGDRLYPWIDPKPVQTFHKENYYDKSIELQITEQALKPKLSITGVPRVGEQVTVSCSVLHTCPPNPPSLSVGKALDTDITVHTPVEDGFWETIRVHTFIIKEEEQTVTCKATFHSGQTSEAQINLNAQCTYKDITIDPEVADVVEGVGNNFTCTVFHSCKGQPPVFTWNYKDMPDTVGTKKGPSLTWATYSNALYIASMEDDGKKLTCTATFPGGEITTSIVLQVQRYVPKVVDPFENDTLHVFEAHVVPRISALTGSCVVIPCTFQTGNEFIPRLRGLWYTNKGKYVYHTGQSNVMDNFKGRTKLLGNPDDKNCTLEIDNVQAHDNGPFCFHAEKGNDKYSFNHSCVFIIMKASPDKPVISALPEKMEPGKRFTINCSVNHTCSSHPPNITWNVPAAREVVSHVERSAGKWETTSTITFIPTGYEEVENLICRASFRKGKYEESSTLLSVKRFEGLGMDSIGLYIILPLFTLLLFCIAAGIICRRRIQKKSSDEPTPERRRSIWSQLSRRYNGAASWLNSSMETSSPPRPPKPEKRRSVWSRFSRRGPVTSTDLMVQYKVNNVSAAATSAGYSKPHFPSPKSEPKCYISGGGHLANYDDDYTNTADFKMHRKM